LGHKETASDGYNLTGDILVPFFGHREKASDGYNTTGLKRLPVMALRQTSCNEQL